MAFRRAVAGLTHVIPDIPVIHRLDPRFGVCRDSGVGANVLLSKGRPSGNGVTLSETAPRSAAEVRKNGSRRKRGPGNRKEEARGGGASQSRTHFPSRVRRNLKPPGGWNRERTTAKLASRTTDREPDFEAARPRRKEPAREPKPAARQGAEPAGTGTGSAMILRRNLRDRPGPRGLGRNLPGKGDLAFTGRPTDLGTVEAGSNAGLHFVLGLAVRPGPGHSLESRKPCGGGAGSVPVRIPLSRKRRSPHPGLDSGSKSPRAPLFVAGC
jgi:hypothetical protein